MPEALCQDQEDQEAVEAQPPIVLLLTEAAAQDLLVQTAVQEDLLEQVAIMEIQEVMAQQEQTIMAQVVQEDLGD